MKWILVTPAELLTLAVSAHFHAGELADLLKLSQRQLHRVFQRQFGCSPQAWLDRARFRAAKARRDRGEPAKNVATDYFQHASNFSHWFRVRAMKKHA